MVPQGKYECIGKCHGKYECILCAGDQAVVCHVCIPAGVCCGADKAGRPPCRMPFGGNAGSDAATAAAASSPV
jgi:hypothetical protein